MINEVELLEQLSKRVKFLREKKGISRRKLSTLSRVNERTLYRIELPDVTFTPSLTTLIKVANGLDVDLYRLFAPIKEEKK